MKGLQRMRAIIAVILAVSLAIFPIAMPQAAVMAGGHHGAATATVHDHHHHDASSATVTHHDHGNVHASFDCMNDHVSDRHHGASCHHAETDSSSDAFCCGNIACHAFQLTASPIVYVPSRSSSGPVVSGEEQIPGDFVGRIDRPPRTI
jgi:hypothetical protein